MVARAQRGHIPHDLVLKQFFSPPSKRLAVIAFCDKRIVQQKYETIEAR